MPIPKFVRESAFELTRHDLALFLEEHEQDLLAIFHEEMQRMDDELPEEAIYIDLDVAGLGDIVVKAALRALRRFLVETPASPTRHTRHRAVPRPVTRPIIKPSRKAKRKAPLLKK